MTSLTCITEYSGLTQGKKYMAFSSAPGFVEVLNDYLRWSVYPAALFEIEGF